MNSIRRAAVALTAGLAAVLEGRPVVDGDVRVRVRGGRVTLLGASGQGYVVGVTGEDGSGGVTTLDAPGTALWRSCGERVAELSPQGARMTTIGILSDGLGPTEIRVRLASGTVVGRYPAKWFGALVFEAALRPVPTY